MSTIALKSPSGTVNLIPEDIAGTHNVTIPSAGVGKVLQVVQDVMTDTFSTTSTTYVDSGLSVTMTPKSTASRFKVEYSVSGANTTATAGTYVRIARGGAPIFDSDAASTRKMTSNSIYLNNVAQIANVSGCFIDSPVTISPIEYTLQVSTQSGYTAVINRSGSDTDAASTPRTTSSITITEIGA